MSGLDLWGVGQQTPRLMGQGPGAGGLRELGGGRELAPGGAFEGAGEVASGGFGDLLAEALSSVKESGADVKEKVEALAAGEPVKLHDILVAMGKSGESFNLMLEMRNKLMEAWQTLQRSVV